MEVDARNKLDAPPGEVLESLTASRALEILRMHIGNPRYDSIVGWYDLGQIRKVDCEAVARELGADDVAVHFSHFAEVKGLFGRTVEKQLWALAIRNPETLPTTLILGTRKVHLDSIQVYNSGNVEYAGVIFSDREAVVRPEFFPELERAGFQCIAASAPSQPVFTGPMQSIFPVDAVLGAGGEEWLRAPRKEE